MCKSYQSKFIEISCALNHQVDEMLVGLVTQIRLNKKRLRRQRTLTDTGSLTCLSSLAFRIRDMCRSKQDDKYEVDNMGVLWCILSAVNVPLEEEASAWYFPFACWFLAYRSTLAHLRVGRRYLFCIGVNPLLEDCLSGLGISSNFALRYNTIERVAANDCPNYF